MIEQRQKKLAIFCTHMVDFHRPGHICVCVHARACVCVHMWCVYICICVCTLSAALKITIGSWSVIYSK